VTYTPNVINQYTAAENSGLTNGTEHEISAAWGANYTYINDGQLSLVSVPGGASTQLYHDALGRVAKRLVNGTQLRYVVNDGEREILEFDSSRAITARNVYGKGIDEILMRADIVSGFTYYYQQDHEGSITHLTNAAGAFLEKYRYDAFGLPTYDNGNGAQISASAYANPYLFTARRKLTWDTYEYRARAYNAELGRFMSEDPKLFDAGDYNLFRYCHNDPLDLTDPMGLQGTDGVASVNREFEHHRRGGGDAQWDMAKWSDRSNNFSGTFAQFASMHNLSMGQVAAGRNLPTQTSIQLDHTFDVSSSQLYAAGVKADAVTSRRLEPPEADIGGGGVINYTQRVTAKTTFKTGLSQEKISSEWKRVESLQQEVRALNSLARTEARRGFPNAEMAKATIGRAVNNDWKQFLDSDSLYFEIFRGGK
jgi:RHS repeat-associated protein